MNNRDYKIFAPGEYYHIYNRGNAKQNIFLDEDDYSFFLVRLGQNLFPDQFKNVRIRKLPDGAFSLISYCLMPNHFHFLIRQNTEIPVSQLLSKICTSYSMYFNKKYKRVGGLFQDQYKMVLVDSNRYLVWLSAYIHQNPTVANLVKDPSDYPWSSYNGFLSDQSDKLDFTEVNLILHQFSSKEDYKKFVNDTLLLIRNKKELESLLLD